MKNRLSMAVILTLILAVVSVVISAKDSQDKIITAPVIGDNIEATATNDEEMRGMWVSYISLDMNGTDYSEKSFRDKFTKIIDTATEYECNALFVHVRAFCDAFYESELFPSSHVLWGKQGVTAEYDALEIMCEMCKDSNIEIHAWLNPYRVMAETSEFELSENNPYVTDITIGVEYDGGIYLNPAKRNVRNLITDGVREIIEKYPVDGIHFDDYFYPTSDESFDKAEYNQYLKAFASERDAMPLVKWRQNNVNMLIAEVYQTIKGFDESIEFGISPQGNIDNDLAMGADVKAWCECMGYVDYICPQLYYSIENPALGFKAGLERWLEFDLHEKLKVYAGLAVYKVGTDADEDTWNEGNILKKELEIIRDKNLDGFVLYDYEAVISDNAQTEMKALKKT